MSSTRQSEVQIERFCKNLYTKIAFANAPELKNACAVVQNIIDLKLVADRHISQIGFLDKRIEQSCARGWFLQYVGTRNTCTCVQDKSP